MNSNTGLERETLVPKQIFHPTDLSEKNRVAFAHALKITLIARGELVVYHVARHADDVKESDFPSPRDLLRAWGKLPADAGPEAVEQLGIRVRNVTSQGSDPVDSALYYLERHPADLLVMATEAKQGLTRLINRAVAEPIASEAEAEVLFLPEGARGFVDMESGRIDLGHVLIPYGSRPDHTRTFTFVALFLGLFGIDDNRITLLRAGSAGDLSPPELPESIRDRCEMVSREGPMAQVVNEFAETEGVNLTVLTTRGKRGLVKVLLGGNTEHVLRKSPCAVLAVPCEENAEQGREDEG